MKTSYQSKPGTAGSVVWTLPPPKKNMWQVILWLCLTAPSSSLSIAVVGAHKRAGRIAAWRAETHGWTVTRITPANDRMLMGDEEDFAHIVIDRNAVSLHGTRLLASTFPKAHVYMVSGPRDAIDTVDRMFRHLM